MFQNIEQQMLEMKQIIDKQNEKISQQQKVIDQLVNQFHSFITKKEIKDALEAGIQRSKQWQNDELQKYGECQSYYALSYIQYFGQVIAEKIPS